MAHTNPSKYLSIIESFPDTFNPSVGQHSHCYRDFTAIQKPQKNTHQNSNKATTRSRLNSRPPSRSGILPSLCTFCDKHRKNVNEQQTLSGKNEKHKTDIAIQNKPMTLKDEKLLLKDWTEIVQISQVKKFSITINVRESFSIKSKKTLAKTNLTE